MAAVHVQMTLALKILPAWAENSLEMRHFNHLDGRLVVPSLAPECKAPACETRAERGGGSVRGWERGGYGGRRPTTGCGGEWFITLPHFLLLALRLSCFRPLCLRETDDTKEERRKYTIHFAPTSQYKRECPSGAHDHSCFREMLIWFCGGHSGRSAVRKWEPALFCGQKNCALVKASSARRGKALAPRTAHWQPAVSDNGCGTCIYWDKLALLSIGKVPWRNEPMTPVKILHVCMIMQHNTTIFVVFKRDTLLWVVYEVK